MELVARWITEVWTILAMSGPYLLVGFLLAGLLKVLVPERWIWRHLGRDDMGSVVKASLVGAPVPLCSCSVIPTAVSLKQAGASKGATTSFLISTPETGIDSVGITWALMDPLMTVTRPLAAVATAIGSGAAVNALVRRGWDVPSGVSERGESGDPAAAADHACCGTEDASTGEARLPEIPPPEPSRGSAQPSGGVLRRASRYAFGTLMADLTPWFVLGFALSALISLLVPADFFGGVVPNGWPAMLAMLFVGVPIYTCATATTPIAAALMAKGLDPGAALVLLLAGPATNVATIAVVQRFLGRRVLAVYLASIAGFALVCGWLVNLLYPGFGLDPRQVAAAGAAEALGPLSRIGGAVLLALLVVHAVQGRLDRRLLGGLRRWLAPLGIDPTTRAARTGLIAALALAYASTALTVLGPSEAGFLVRFGEVRREMRAPGPYLHLPYPFERVERVPTDLVRGATFGFDEEGLAPRPYAATGFQGDGFDDGDAGGRRDLAAEAEVVTGDEAILRVAYATHYAVRDPRRYRFGIEGPEELVRALTEAAVRRMAAGRASDALLSDHRAELEREAARLLQEELDGLDAGVRVVALHLVDVHAPPEVHTAFRDVASALEDRERDARRGESYATERLASARAEAWSLEQGALAERGLELASVAGAAERFTRVLDEIEKAPDVALTRMRLEAAGKALAGARLVLVLGAGIDVELLEEGADAPAGVQDGKTRPSKPPANGGDWFRPEEDGR